MQGETEAAAEALAAQLRLRSDFSLAWTSETLPFAGEVGERWLEGLRKAGVPRSRIEISNSQPRFPRTLARAKVHSNKKSRSPPDRRTTPVDHGPALHQSERRPRTAVFCRRHHRRLTTDLSRLAEMSVISRNTAFTYRDRPADTKQIGRELGVRYVVEGKSHLFSSA